MTHHPDEYVLLTNVKEIVSAFRSWHDALQDGAKLTTASQSWWVDEQGIGVRLRKDPARSSLTDPAGSLLAGADLTVGPGFHDIVVQINPGNRPGDGNVPSAAARSPDGRLWLVRQAWLQGKQRFERTEPRIEAPEFLARTGLSPVQVKVATGPKDRTWCIVCPLSEGPQAVRDHTGAYVRRASLARSAGSDPIETGHPDQQRIQELSAGLPVGGEFAYRGQEGGIGRRLEDEVVAALADLISPPDTPRRWRRPMHAAGYTVDLEVISASPPLLIEAKADNSAGHVQQGVGQLILYPLLIPRLQSHRRVLLLPRSAAPAMEKAICDAGILRFSYRWTGGQPGKGSVEFDPALLDLCMPASSEVR